MYYCIWVISTYAYLSLVIVALRSLLISFMRLKVRSASQDVTGRAEMILSCSTMLGNIRSRATVSDFTALSNMVCSFRARSCLYITS